MATVRIASGPAAGRSLPVDREVVIGREGADLTVADAEMSRRQLALRPAGEGIEIEDLGSLNGTIVDGRKIDEPVTVTRSATIKAGTTQFELDIPAPAPQVTAPRQVVTPDVTAPRQVVTPDVTAPRQVVTPDVTAPRDVVSPDVTAPRQVVSPDVTAPRQVPGPDVTAPRAAEPPAPGARAPSDPGAPPAAPAPARRRPPILPIAGALLALAALVALGLSMAAEDDPQSHTLDVTLRNTFLEFKGRTETATGVVAGAPFGSGSTRLDTVYPGTFEEALPGPTEVTTRFTFLFDDGTITGTGRFTLRGATGKDASLDGRLEFDGGTRAYEDAKGSGRLRGTLDGDANPPRSNSTLRGKVEY